MLITLAQVLTVTGITVTAAIVDAVRGGMQRVDSFAVFLEWRAAMVFAPAVVTALTVAAITRWWAWHLVLNRSRSGMGLVFPSGRTALLWSCAGALLGGVYLAPAFSPQIRLGEPRGAFAQLATSGVAESATWVAMVLIYGPFVEEFLFRGLLFRGYAESWGVTRAGAAITTLFLAIHLPETAQYWPATAAILGIGILTLAARVVTGSLVTAMLTHFAYNLVIVGGVAALRWTG